MEIRNCQVMLQMKTSSLRQKAFVFILLLGVISLLSDFTHEGARSIYGPYLGLLGVSAFVIAFTSGLGEFIGQGLRIITGIIADKSKKYWTMMILGYGMNLLAIPLLMVVEPSASSIAILLILLERVGKSIRAPAKSALISFTSPHLGAGKAFALQEALDQLGAFLGPLFVFLLLSVQGAHTLSSYQLAFGALGIFAIFTLVTLIISKWKYPHPEEFETTKEKSNRFSSAFYWYLGAISFLALGFIDYPVIAYHLESMTSIEVVYIPLLYALAMGVDAIAALIFGSLFDRIGETSLQIAIGIAMFYVPFAFLSQSPWLIIVGIILWGIGMGAQESILKAVVALVVSKEKRATAYGWMNAIFGLAWWLGSMAMGALYQVNLLGMVIFSIVMELFSIGFLFIFKKKKQSSKF